MQVLTFEKLLKQKEPFAAAIGFFDGVHIGHQKVIDNAVNHANDNDLKSLVITFDRSPKVAITEYLTPMESKLQHFTMLGVDYVLVLEFNELLRELSADDFVENYLIQLGVVYVSVGFDFRFGHRGTGDTSHLQKWREFEVDVCNPVLLRETKVSSTSVKKSLQMGDLEAVKTMLGRNFSINGVVGHGRQLGRTIGFPTANLMLDEQFLGLSGVFTTRVMVEGKEYFGMTNIGYNPTANLQESVSVETHIFEFNEDIYGCALDLEFLYKIRDEIKFEGIEQLIAQLEADKIVAISLRK